MAIKTRRFKIYVVELIYCNCRGQVANAVISVDAGPLHIAAAMGTPTLAVVGNGNNGVSASPIRLWMPRCVAFSEQGLISAVLSVPMSVSAMMIV